MSFGQRNSLNSKACCLLINEPLIYNFLASLYQKICFIYKSISYNQQRQYISHQCSLPILQLRFKFIHIAWANSNSTQVRQNCLEVHLLHCGCNYSEGVGIFIAAVLFFLLLPCKLASYSHQKSSPQHSTHRIVSAHFPIIKIHFIAHPFLKLAFALLRRRIILVLKYKVFETNADAWQPEEDVNFFGAIEVKSPFFEDQ